MDLESLKKKLHIDLKFIGTSLRREFCSLIIESLHAASLPLNDKDTYENCVKIISNSLEKDFDIERSIERKDVEHAIEICLRSGYEEYETIFNVINSFDVPKLQYNVDRKLFYISNIKPKLLSNAEDKAQLFIDRYNTVLQRAQRHFLNKQSGIKDKDKITLHTVDFLLTVSYKTLNNALILGSLLIGPKGNYFLEDPTGRVELDLTHTKYGEGFFHENCFVLANGQYDDKVFQVTTMLLPPSEEYKESWQTFNNLNYFGGLSESSLRESVKLLNIMNENESAMILFISDLWLDQHVVFEKLETLFQGFAESPPIAFIMMGNFLSKSYGSESVELLQKLFKQLAELISNFEGIVKYSKFVFIPGLNDPCITHIVPRLPLPKIISETFKKIIPQAIFPTNPCRLQYCTREIVVFRADILSKFMHESLHKPTKEEVDSFGHLSPFSLNVQPVHWSFDYTLTLYPLPNLVVIGDKSNPFSGTQKGCCILNPGSFIDSNFSFKTYVPFSEEVEECAL